jgi:hypothetical protein
MRLALLALALAFGTGANAQTITDYPTAPTVKTLTVGTLSCTIWSQSPSPAFVQVACCNTTCAGVYSGPLVLNTIYDVTLSDVFGGIEIPGVGAAIWMFSPTTTPSGINYQISVQALTGPATNPPISPATGEPIETGTF